MSIRGYLALGTLALVGVLFAFVLWYRGQSIEAKAESKQWEKAALDYRKANETNLTTIGKYQQARAANDKLALELASELASIKARGIETRTIVREVIRNDPQAADWSNAPVPRNVRDAANGG